MSQDKRQKLVSMGYIVNPYNLVALDKNKNTVVFINEKGEYYSPIPEVDAVFKEDEELVRARNEDGTFVADDPSTPDINEAWTKKPNKKAKRKGT
jgi:hypothetical protein